MPALLPQTPVHHDILPLYQSTEYDFTIKVTRICEMLPALTSK